MLLNIKCVSIFSTTFVWNIPHSTKNSARYHKCTYVRLYLSTHYSCQILMELVFSRQTFEKYPNIKFHKNPFSRARVVPLGRSYYQQSHTQERKMEKPTQESWKYMLLQGRTYVLCSTHNSRSVEHTECVRVHIVRRKDDSMCINIVSRTHART